MEMWWFLVGAGLVAGVALSQQPTPASIIAALLVVGVLVGARVYGRPPLPPGDAAAYGGAIGVTGLLLFVVARTAGV